MFCKTKNVVSFLKIATIHAGGEFCSPEKINLRSEALVKRH